MVRIEGEPGSMPTRFEHVVWRILDDIRRALANRDNELAIVMVGELEDYALTFSKRRNDIVMARTLEDYTLTKVAEFLLKNRTDAKVREHVLKSIQEFFALSVRRPVALAALAPIIAMNTGIQVAKLGELLPYIVQHINRILAMNNIPLRFEGDELKKVIKRGWF